MTIALSHGGPTIYETGEQSQRVLVGTARGITTIERSGAGWRVAADALTDKHIGAILIEPRSGAIFAGGYGDGSLSVSFDGGETWQPRDKGLTEHDIYSLEAIEVDGGVRIYSAARSPRSSSSRTTSASPGASCPVSATSRPSPPGASRGRRTSLTPSTSPLTRETLARCT